MMLHAAKPLSFQRGAGTLMATVFLLLIVALLGGIGLRMASTDINDTALQNDGVEALFLAESGLERTLQRLSAGTTCAALMPDAAQTLGRGTFQLQSASLLPSGLCRVQMLGSVGLAGATPATRLIEADLSMGGCRGFAVGDRINNGPPAQRGPVLLCWDGTTWTRAAYAGLPNANLYSVSCPAANDCWAVGAASGGENIQHWDGTAWTRWPVSAIPNVNLWAVHCIADDDCWAVGSNINSGPAAQRGEVIIHWDGSAWSRSGPWNNPATGVQDTVLNAVTCSASDDCWAVGNASGGEVIAHWDGTNWTRSGPIVAVPDVTLRGITCLADDDCRAVGSPASGELFLEWNGSNWSRSGLTASIPNNATFNAVDCVTATNCWAVGNQSGGELLARWNGAAWSRHPATGAIPNRTLRGLFMVDANEGYSVGDNGLIIRWNGAWATQASPVTARLRSVAMAPAGGGTVAVQRWREIIQ